MFKRLLPFFFILGLISGLTSCRKEKETTLFRLLSPEETGIDFSNTITENDSVNLLDYEYIYNGGGVAVTDINLDGLPDLFFSGNMVPSRLYLNQGNFKFQDITKSAGITSKNWATGVAVADVNADGYPDIYVCSAGHLSEEKRANLLYINNGNNSFTESAAAYGVDDKGYSTMAAFLDYDLDGDLDLYVVTYANDTWDTSVIYPKVTDGSGKATDRLYRNNGNNTFTNVSKEAGILIEGYGLGVAVCDINRDGWPDIYISNDYIDDDFIYINNQNGTFTESASKFLNHISHFAMGNDIADINNDSYADIMVVDMQPEDNERQKLFSMTKNYDKFMMTLKMGYLPAYMRNTLQLNNGNGSFSEIGQLAGIHHTDWSWAPLLADFDNDGYKDMFITNGYPKDIMNRDFLVYNKYATSIQAVKMPASLEAQHRFKLQAITELQGSKIENYIFKNNGDLTFTKKSAAWGINNPTFSNGAAYADLDIDGDLDLVVNNINDPASVYENNARITEKNNYLRLKLHGDSLNPSALGATVKLYSSLKGVQYLENYPYRGFQSSVESILHFGLGKDTFADSVEIKWPDGKYTTLTKVKTNQIITAHHRDAVKRSPLPDEKKSTLFENATARLGIKYVHKETDYNDFKIQTLLPHKFSQSGPGVAVADVNGDGLSDFYVGGAQQSPGEIYIQTATGEFIAKSFKQNYISEDLGTLFFDADGDGDQDLYIVSGGSEEMAEVAYYQDRLYFNDGTGNFMLEPSALPRMSESGSCVIAADYDKDGDLDLFVGGRIHPGKYPLPAKSYLLRNDGGKFEDVTDLAGGNEFARMGMVSSALWTDFDDDGQLDLMVAGEWMPVTFFKNNNGQFTNVTGELGLSRTTGWWNSLAGGDFDNDGDTDYVIGNTGRNSRYKPTEKEPLMLYTKDFDQNASLDPVLTYYLQGEKHLVHSRDELIGQISMIRKQFPRYEQYAKAKFSDIFKEKDLDGAYILKAEIFESSYLENEGNGKFALKPLPIEAQFAPIFGMLATDADGDGNLDLIAVGNSHAPEISLGRYDASFGILLKGNGTGDFQPVPFDESGFFAKGDSKGIAALMDGKGQVIFLVTKNGGPMEAIVQKNKDSKILRLDPMDAWSEITFSDGRKRKQELPYGNTYLSQSDRVLVVPDDAVRVDIFSYSGTLKTATDYNKLSAQNGN
ncbi:MAG: VCBS repeat-containing protein [Cyclobacteriaceae bacterium]